MTEGAPHHPLTHSARPLSQFIQSSVAPVGAALQARLGYNRSAVTSGYGLQSEKAGDQRVAIWLPGTYRIKYECLDAKPRTRVVVVEDVGCAELVAPSIPGVRFKRTHR